MGDAASSPRLRGRQGEARRNDGNLLAAARLVLALDGPSAPVSAIAEEAGVGVASLYRRYPTKAALVEYLCAESLDQQIDAAETALADGGDGLPGFIHTCVGLRAGVFTSLAGSIDPTPGLTRKAETAHELVQRLVIEAQAADAVRPDLTATDVHQLIELFSRRGRDADCERLLKVSLDGLRATGAAPLTPSAASWRERYARPWSTRLRE